MRILVTGSSGLIGTSLAAGLAAAGHRVARLRRSGPRGPDEYTWHPDRGLLDAKALRDCDAVVHLAGESIAGGRWSQPRRAAIRASRVEATRLLCTTMAGTVPSP